MYIQKPECLKRQTRKNLPGNHFRDFFDAVLTLLQVFSAPGRTVGCNSACKDIGFEGSGLSALGGVFGVRALGFRVFRDTLEPAPTQ